MNIFITDNDPKQAAQDLCDRHVVKMILESCQLLCSPFEKGTAPYKRTHFNHPCSKWARASKANYEWLILHTEGLLAEYTFRYNKIHKSTSVLEWCKQNYLRLNFEKSILTPFAQAMPEQYKNPADAVTAYRTYYKMEKINIAKWKNGRQPPGWWYNG